MTKEAYEKLKENVVIHNFLLKKASEISDAIYDIIAEDIEDEDEVSETYGKMIDCSFIQEPYLAMLLDEKQLEDIVK